MNVKLYSTNCPKCQVLEKKLVAAKVPFELISKFDVKAMRDKGFMGAPILQVEDEFMDFAKANEWVNNIKG